MARLGRQLAPERVALVANKVRDERELEAVRELAEAEGLDIVGAVPDDERVREAERAGCAPLDFDPEAPAVAAVDDLARRLLPPDGDG